MIVMAELNNVNPRAWLVEILARITDHLAQQPHELLSWNWAAKGHDTLAA